MFDRTRLVSLRGFGRVFHAAWVPTLITVALAHLCAPCGAVLAQSTEPSTPAASAAGDATVGRESPYGAVRAYLEACRRADFEKAATFLDLQRIPHAEREPRGPILARHLDVVLQRELWFALRKMSRGSEGNLDDGLPPDLECVGTIRTDRGDVDILVERVRTVGAEAPAWRFESATVERIPDLYEELGYGPLGEILPEPFFTVRFLNIELWQWIGLLIIALVAGIFSRIATLLLHRFAKSIVSRTETQLDDRILHAAEKPLRLVVAIVFFSVGAAFLALSAPVHEFLGQLVRGLAVVAVTWLLFRLVDGFRDQVRRRFEEEGRRAALAVVPLGVKTTKAALILMAFIAMLQTLGFNVTGLIAGLGVGGIALALAAQKTIENLFGGVTLAVDQPVRVGDFCRYGGEVGTVEDVGLRSTRVRTLDRTVVSIPNAEFSQMKLENFAKRDQIRLHCTLGLRYETDAEQLRYVLTGLRRLLLAHPKVHPDPARVRFVGFGAYSLDLEVFAYIVTTDWNEFLAVREDLLLRIMEIVTEAGTGFAFPSQTTYLGRDSGLDADRTRQAREAVRQWRDEARLPFPDLGADTISELEDTLDYPPRGSVLIGRPAS